MRSQSLSPGSQPHFYGAAAAGILPAASLSPSLCVQNAKAAPQPLAAQQVICSTG